MSRRTVSRFVLAYLLSVALVAPAAAQTPNPRPVESPIAPAAGYLGLSLSVPPLFDIDLDFTPTRAVAPPPRAKGVVAGDFEVFVEQIDVTALPRQFPRPSVAPPCCAFDCPQRLTPVSNTAPMPRPAVTHPGEVMNLTWTYNGPPLAADWNTTKWQVNPAASSRYPCDDHAAAFIPFPVQVPNGTYKACETAVSAWNRMWKECPEIMAAAAANAPGTAEYDSARGRLAGTWYRDLDGAAVLSAAFSKDELQMCMTQNADGHTVRIILTADYAVTKEGLVHGVVTGADVEVKADPKARADDAPLLGMELTELSAGMQELVDCPFSFRVKQTSAGMMVSKLRVGGEVGKAAGSGGDLGPTAMLCGMYKFAADGKPPAPKPMKSAGGCGVGRCETYHDASMTLPSPQYLQHYPQYFPPDPTFPLPRELAAQELPYPVVVCPNPMPAQPWAANAMIQKYQTTNEVRVTVMPPCVTAPPFGFQAVPAAPPVPGPGVAYPHPVPMPVEAWELGYSTGEPRNPVLDQAIREWQSRPMGWSPRQAPNVPAVEFGMMADVFGQMLGLNQTYTLPQPIKDPQALLCPPGLVPPCPQVVAQPCPPVGMTPAPVYGPGLLPAAGTAPWAPPPPAGTTAVRVPPPAAPPPAPAARVAMPLPPTHATKPGMVGTWVREVGPVVYVVKVAADHLTITATAATEFEDGKVVTEGMVITADYHLARDGTTLVGLITGVDVLLDATVVPETASLEGLGDELERAQKALTDKPFALSVRVYGDALVIGNVRLPQVEGGRGAMSPLTVLGGRYRNAGDVKDSALLKPKPAKVSVPRSFDGPLPGTPPVVGAAVGAGVGFPVDGPPITANPYVTPPVVVMPPGCDRIPPTNCLPVLPPPPASAPPAPAPPMAVPTRRIPPSNDLPPPPVETPKAGKKGKKKAGGERMRYETDLNVRMQQLLYQSEDLRQLHNEWRRFWFNDHPSHLTPERIHGGIQ